MTALFAVDGHHLLYRAWFGFPARIMSRDRTRDLTGVFGFLALARKAHHLHAPDSEMVVVFDGEFGTADRVRAEPTYKANRATADHTPIKSLPAVKQALSAACVRWAELDNHEGDDVLATAISAATRQGRPVICFSGDRDFYQLLDDTVTILTPTRAELTGADVQRRFGVLPRQWPDYRALTGDPADNIPGIRGIGPKTAASLLSGGLHLEDLPASPRLDSPRCREVREQWDQVLAWRDIIRLRDDVALPADIVTGQPTPPLPRAAQILEHLDLW
ncbi:5'-3' exonuclease H3TH domain-containing protein [Micromonospora sp. NPDC050397]|uniref:5'-3' exonuclease n=1 Tax=Micromonospora sp. NPDC050397 TaxID=3364279 RepID=UPI0038508A77